MTFMSTCLAIGKQVILLIFIASFRVIGDGSFPPNPTDGQEMTKNEHAEDDTGRQENLHELQRMTMEWST